MTATTSTPDYVTRGPTPTDLDFIVSSWLKSYRNSDFANYIPNTLYYQYHKAIVMDLLKRSLVSMVVDPEDQDHVYGYIVYEAGEMFILHYMYIKSAFRNFGLAKSILQKANPQFGVEEMYLTHLDKVDIFQNSRGVIKRNSWFIKKRSEYKMIYNPYAMI